MRTLPNLANQHLFTPEVQLQILASDQSTTFVHCSHAPGDAVGIVGMTALEWEGPFGGGLGLPSLYDVTLSFPASGGMGMARQNALDEIKTRLPRYQGGLATLRVDVASHTFYPHVGRVRGASRDGNDPTLLTLRIVDRFTGENPMIPGTALVDSYSTVHPEDQDKGLPWYYGDETKRPFYFVATDCDIGVLQGPRNVSSASHVTSLWVNALVVTRAAASPGRTPLPVPPPPPPSPRIGGPSIIPPSFDAPMDKPPQEPPSPIDPGFGTPYGVPHYNAPSPDRSWLP